MKLIDEIESRLYLNKTNFSVLGAELKAQRLQQNLTLKEASSKVCSVSYLCKIERNEINPNPAYLEKLCDKMAISSEELKIIYNLNSYLENMIKAYYYEDNNTIDNIYNSIKKFDNYKAKIIKLIYYDYNNLRVEGIEINNKLTQIISSMNDFDLIIYALFQAVLYIKLNNLGEALQILKRIKNSNNINDYIKALIHMGLLKIYYITNSRNFLPTFFKSKDINNALMNHQRYDDSMFMLAKYYLINGIYEEFSLMIQKFKKTKYETTIKLIDDIFKYNVKKIENYKAISKFYYYVGLYYCDNKRFKETTKDFYGLNDYEVLYLKYLENTLLDDETLAFAKLNSEFYPTALNYSAIYLVRQIADSIIKKLCKDSRYKLALDKVIEINKKLREYDSI